MKDVFLIFCEGQTEEAYIDMLRRYFRAPICIVSSIQGQSVSKHLIDEYKRSMQLNPSDRVSTFLMSDLDVAELLPWLQNCDAELLASNPTIELWFLLRSADQCAAVASKDVVHTLQQSAHEWRNYHKGMLTDKQTHLLQNNMSLAVERAALLNDMANPSSRIYLLVRRLQAESNRQTSCVMPLYLTPNRLTPQPHRCLGQSSLRL